MGIGDWVAVLEMLLESPEHVAVIVSTVVALLIVVWLLKQCISWVYRVRVVVAGLSAVCLAMACELEDWDSACLAVIVLVMVVSASISSYQAQDQKLEKVARYDDQQNVNRDPAKALALIESINPNVLAGLQRERYQRYRAYTYVALGNNRVARELLMSPKSKELMTPAFRHFFLHYIAELAANYEESQNQLSIAMAHKDDAGTDILTKLQLEHNQAVLHINKGQHQIANDELEKVIARVHEYNVRNKDFLNVVYYNYLTNLTLIGLPDDGESRGLAAIDRYASELDLSDPSDILALFNLRLVFMRRIGASAERKNELYLSTLDDLVTNSRFTSNQKAVGVASLGGVCWFDGLDPTPVIDFFAARHDVLFGLGPADRYTSCLNLENLLTSLRVTQSDPNDRHAGSQVITKLSECIAGYFHSDASKDLDAWERMLPAEAYLQRARLLNERASLCLRQGDVIAAAKKLDEAIVLLEDNLLSIEAMEYRLRLAKLVVTREPERAIKLVRAVEVKAQEMGDDPSLGYLYASACLCYALANRRDECLRTYDLAARHKVPMSLFDPRERMGMAVSAFCARFFMFTRAIEELKRDCSRLSMSETAKAWVVSYPHVQNLSIILLLARFLGYTDGVPIVRRRMVAKDGTHDIWHCWLEFFEAGIAFDPTIRGVQDGVMGRVFDMDAHPMVTLGKSDLERYERNGYEVLPIERTIGAEAMLDQTMRDVIEEVGTALESLTANVAPSRQELTDAYLCGVANTPVPM